MATPTPRISIVTRTCDRPDALRRAADGLRAQSVDFEWVVVNDGQSPLDSAVLDGVSQSLTVLDPDTPLGRSGAAAHGFRSATGHYLMLHDDDDALKPDALAALADYLDQNSAAIGVSCAYQTFEEQKDQPPRLVRTHHHTYPPRLYDLAERNSLLTIGTLFRKTAYDQVGGIRTDIDALEDWDLWLKLMTVGDIAILDKVLAEQYWRPAGTEGAAANSRREEHELAHIRLQNAYLRDDIAAGRVGLGDLMHRPHGRFIEEVDDRLKRAGALKRKLMPWGRGRSDRSNGQGKG